MDRRRSALMHALGGGAYYLIYKFDKVKTRLAKTYFAA